MKFLLLNSEHPPIGGGPGYSSFLIALLLYIHYKEAFFEIDHHRRYVSY